MRKVVNAQIGEAWRLWVLFGSTWPFLFADAQTWKTVREQYVAVVQSLDTIYFVFILIVFVFALILLVFMAYVALAAVIWVLLAVLRRARPDFVTVRSVVAVASWIGMIPAAAALGVAGAVLPDAMIARPSPSFYTLLASVIYVPYFALCTAEAFGTPLMRAFVIAAIANIGLNLSFGLAFNWFETLTASA